MTIKPKVFIGSSREAMAYVNAIHDQLSFSAEVTPWHAGVFRGNDYPMEALERQLESNDFAVFVLSPDDVIRMRGKTYFIARDNTMFEMGLFWGKLRRGRVFFMIPDQVQSGRDGQEVDQYHLASDLEGLTVLKYEAHRTDANRIAAVNQACSFLIGRIHELGFFLTPDKELESAHQELTLLRSVVHFYRDFNKGILERDRHENELIDAVRNAYEASCIHYKVKGAALWEASSDEIRQIAGNVGKERIYSIQANNKLGAGEPRKLVVDAYLNSKIEFIQIGQDVVNEYLLCYPISSSHVISIHITGHSPVSPDDFERLFQQNQGLMGIIHHLFGGDWA
ncbi:TIR domain-containing protein [Paenibacillus sepulcri]|uniref:Nucleotide-binding protein n=1 Tax=Paenibacillus sepulcri TaxID=359917 RepID=A0ABS7C0Y2_9BACL|nr:nucleotide-binding protein [Paenibacillus sepulcri]